MESSDWGEVGQQIAWFWIQYLTVTKIACVHIQGGSQLSVGWKNYIQNIWKLQIVVWIKLFC